MLIRWLDRIHDKKLVLRYAITGVSVAAFYAVLHLSLSRLAGLSSSLASIIALTAALMLQYFMHSAFTFQGNWKNAPQLGRFLVTIIIGLAVSHAIMAYIGPAWLLPEIVRIGLVVTILPVANFVLFSLWVFAFNRRSNAANQ